MKLNKRLAGLARRIKLVAMDIDGVLTGGEMIIMNSGEEIKIWNVKDRFGFHLAYRSGAGIKFAWITGRRSKQAAAQAKEIGIDFLYQDCMRKKDAIEEIMSKTGIKRDEILYIGDDLVDIPVLNFVGIGICPSDAPVELKNAADLVSKLPGGKGVLREAVEMILKAQGLWKKAGRDYLA
jgi:3-deoxy-D-manno-octulosonate 8-phosphate phosphatase (KDO 8-P phosphatase)